MEPSFESMLTQLDEHLTNEATLKQRQGDFDMEDAPDDPFLEHFKEFHSALVWLGKVLTVEWRTYDQEALRYQSQHRRLAHIAIFAGISAIVIAVFQLAVKATLGIMPGLPSLFTNAGVVLEIVAFISATLAVAVGLAAKFDRRWLGQRHLAERLRMLKFRALVEFLCRDRASWESWVETQLQELKQAANFSEVEKWSMEGETEPFIPSIVSTQIQPDVANSLTSYYLAKRLGFQADYFKQRHDNYEPRMAWWRRLSPWLFLASLICVLGHFVFDFLSHNQHVAGNEELAKSFEVIAIWLTALAAIIPIGGLGVRAWFAAFELPRSANLFAAKNTALRQAIAHLKNDSGDIPATIRHMTQAEHFLEHEHREWLRLLRDTEWFV